VEPGDQWDAVLDPESPSPAPRGPFRPPLPAPETWPQNLRTSLSLCVADDLPVAVAQQAEAGIALAFPDGRLRFVNDRFCEIVGRPRRALDRLNIADITHADDWPACGAAIDTLLRSGEPFDAEKRFLRPDGGCVWVRNTVSVLRDAAGRIDSLISVVFDVSEQRRSEEERRQDQRRQNFLLQLSDALRMLAEPARIEVEATRILGEFLGANRVAYAEVQNDEIVVNHDYVRDIPSMKGRYPRSAFGSQVSKAMLTSGTYQADHLQDDPALPESEREAWRRIGCASYVAVTLVKENQFNAVFAVHSATPRAWTPTEVAIVTEVADRIWSAVERARAESALRKREQELARVQRIGGVGGFDVDVLNGLTGRRSPEYLNLHGLPPHVVTETHDEWARRVHAEDRVRAERALLEALSGTGSVYESEYRIVRPCDNQIRWLSAVADIERDEHGRAVRLIGAHIDITERKRVDAELEESERRLRGLLEGLPQLVWRAHPQGEWTWTSPQWTAFTGLAADRSHGMGWLAALPEADRGVARAAWRDADVRGSLDFHHRLRHAGTGQDRWFHSRALAVHDAQGALVEWLGTSTDVDEQVRASEALTRSSEELERRVAQRTADLQQALGTLRREADERRRVEERLLQSEKLKAIGQLSGGIAHDFNNLLQVLTTGLEVMRRNLERGQVADLRKDIERAQRATRRAAALTQRLLAFGRQQHLSPRPVTFDQVARDIEEMVRRTVGPGVQVDLQLHASDWLVECDVGQMESALLNLCVNARDAMPDGGWLTISTAELTLTPEEALHIADAHPGRYACIAVSDTGVGMSEDLQGRVFEPFFTTKPQGRGTGLGLSQIYGFVRQSGGLIHLHSRSGEGTTVRLMLPFHSHAREEEGADDSGRRTVLLVEDEDDVREITASTLRTFGYKVLEAGDGPTALRLVKSAARVDALVCDYGLPGGMNGQQVIDAIHELQPAVATILATAYAAGLIRPGVTVLRKPFEIQDLASRLEAQLDGIAR
jgi:PAS domain S-box-containing protein